MSIESRVQRGERAVHTVSKGWNIPAQAVLCFSFTESLAVQEAFVASGCISAVTS